MNWSTVIKELERREKAQREAVSVLAASANSDNLYQVERLSQSRIAEANALRNFREVLEMGLSEDERGE